MNKIRTWLSLRLWRLACWLWPRENGTVIAGLEYGGGGLDVTVERYDENGNLIMKSSSPVGRGDLVKIESGKYGGKCATATIWKRGEYTETGEIDGD